MTTELKETDTKNSILAAIANGAGFALGVALTHALVVKATKRKRRENPARRRPGRRARFNPHPAP